MSNLTTATTLSGRRSANQAIRKNNSMPRCRSSYQKTVGEWVRLRSYETSRMPVDVPVPEHRSPMQKFAGCLVISMGAICCNLTVRWPPNWGEP